MVLTDEGEADFYYAARNSTQPLSIPEPRNSAEFPQPPAFKVSPAAAVVSMQSAVLDARAPWCVRRPPPWRCPGEGGARGMAAG